MDQASIDHLLTTTRSVRRHCYPTQVEAIQRAAAQPAG